MVDSSSAEMTINEGCASKNDPRATRRNCTTGYGVNSGNSQNICDFDNSNSNCSSNNNNTFFVPHRDCNSTTRVAAERNSRPPSLPANHRSRNHRNRLAVNKRSTATTATAASRHPNTKVAPRFPGGRPRYPDPCYNCSRTSKCCKGLTAQNKDGKAALQGCLCYHRG